MVPFPLRIALAAERRNCIAEGATLGKVDGGGAGERTSQQNADFIRAPQYVDVTEKHAFACPWLLTKLEI